MQAPITSEQDNIRKLGDNLWHWRGKFLIRTYTPDKTSIWWAFNKFEEGKGKDLAWFSYSLKSIRDICLIMSEDIPSPIVEDLIPTNYET